MHVSLHTLAKRSGRMLLRKLGCFIHFFCQIKSHGFCCHFWLIVDAESLALEARVAMFHEMAALIQQRHSHQNMKSRMRTMQRIVIYAREMNVVLLWRISAERFCYSDTAKSSLNSIPELNQPAALPGQQALLKYLRASSMSGTTLSALLPTKASLPYPTCTLEDIFRYIHIRQYVVSYASWSPIVRNGYFR